MDIWGRLLGEGSPQGQDKLLTDPPPLAHPGQVAEMLGIPWLVDLDIEVPLDIDLADFTLTLPVDDAMQLKALLKALEMRRTSP